MKVTNIADRRRETGAATHARGEAFRFEPYTYDDDGFGSVESGEVVVVLDPGALTGIRMSRDDALRFGAALIQSAVGLNGGANERSAEGCP